MNTVPNALDRVHSVGNDLWQALVAFKASRTADTRLELKKLFSACKEAVRPFNRQTDEVVAPFKASFLGKVWSPYYTVLYKITLIYKYQNFGDVRGPNERLYMYQ
ncbi:hypothetical protein FPV67DRAFT_1676633 [Lyophyllum atratum]|nr:hypothetical protein FPV67DRAFT_1676633 [Lyophyllum atratum]